MTIAEAEAAELARWTVGGQPAGEWLASGPKPELVRSMLIRVLDRPNRGGAWGRALAAYLGADLDALYAEHHPRKAARYAAECRARGDHPHANRLHAALIALMFCANCGRPLVDPVSIDRGIGPDCWQVINPGWQAAIERRVVVTMVDQQMGLPPGPGRHGALW